MILKEAEQSLERFLNDVTLSLGFKHIKDRRYKRLEHDAMAHLSFPCRLSVREYGLFTVYIGLRFESLAIWIDEYPEEKPSTIGKPISLLRETTKFIEWEFSNSNDLERLRDIVLHDLNTYAIPYIERYSRLSDLKNALESKNKEDWFSTGLNVDSRVTVLATIRFVEGDKTGAIKLLDDGIKILEESLADKPYELRKREFRKRSFDMEYLREKFIKAG
jgi:hypothetical protein